MEGAWAPWALVLATNAFFQSCWRLGDCSLLLLLLLLLSSAAAAVVFGAVRCRSRCGLRSRPAVWACGLACCVCLWLADGSVLLIGLTAGASGLGLRP